MNSFQLEHYEKLESYIPVDLFSPVSFLIAFAVVFFFVVFRYFLLTGSAYWFFWKSGYSGSRPLHDRQLPRSQVRNEIYWSLIASLIFALSGVIIGMLWQQGWTQIYLEFDRFGWVYLPLSFLIYSLVHEVYFYFTHIWMHQPGLYRRVHLVHHQSIKTSPWASFSFHPWESLVHAVFLPLMVLVLPIHPVVIISYLTFMTLTAISNHLGFEMVPFASVRAHFISGGHHARHHQKANCNYGLYFTFMDRLMGTEAGSQSRVKTKTGMGARTVYE